VDLARRRPHPPARAPRAAGEPVRRGVVHALALYLAEGTHALDHADEVDDLLVLDGPIYPKELFTWDDRNPELGALAREAKPRAVVEKYVRLVERFVERDVPLAGFVKNPPAGRSFARWLGRASNRRGPTTRRFSPGSGAARGRRGRRRQPTPDRVDDELTFTTWFRSRGGADATMAADGDALGIERELDPELYEPTFMVVYDPGPT